MRNAIACFFSFVLLSCHYSVSEYKVNDSPKIAANKDTQFAAINYEDEKYLSSLPLEKVAALIVNNQVTPLDNDVTFRCLDSAISPIKETREKYFSALLVITKKADGALAERMGSYLITYIKNYTCEFAERQIDDSSNKSIIDYIGGEFAYDENTVNATQWISVINKNASNCNTNIKSRIDSFSKQILNCTKQAIQENKKLIN